MRGKTARSAANCGSATAPRPVSEITPGAAGSDPAGFTLFDGTLYFAATDAEAGRELWATDGTTDGTQRVADLQPGPGDSDPDSLTAAGDRLFFTASRDGRRELWLSDGTDTGTRRIRDILEPGSPYFYLPDDVTAVGDRVFFSANSFNDGRELWGSDGTAEGTRMVRDLRPGSEYTPYDPFVGFERPLSGDPQDLTAVGNQLFFTADDGDHGRELWVSDGTTEGTQLVADIFPGSGDSSSGSHIIALAAVGNRLYFAAAAGAAGRELWMSDGTTSGTKLVRDLFVGTPSADPAAITLFRGEAFFAATNRLNGRELWASDGSFAGTRLVAELRTGFDLQLDSNPFGFTSVATSRGEMVFFFADDVAYGRELWARSAVTGRPP